MKIKRARLYHVELPFRTSIDHFLKKRDRSNSLILIIETFCGKSGYGEGVPRAYISGETIKNNKHYFDRISDTLINKEFNTLEDIEKLIANIRIPGSRASVITAIETALLDVLGKDKNQSITQLFDLDNRLPVQYSGIIPFCSSDSLVKTLHQIRSLGLRSVKIKVGHGADVEYVAIARRLLGRSVDIRVDANQAWDFEEAKHKIKALGVYSVSGIEEPLKKNLCHLLPKLSKSIDVPIILDEQLTSLKTALHWVQKMDASKIIFNLKISKCGGFANASRIHKMAKTKGITCSLGCNVGESAILSAVGRAFISTHELKYAEGSYGRYILEDDLTFRSPSFGLKGYAEPFKGPGLGIFCVQDKINQFGQIISDTQTPKNLYPNFLTQLKLKINAKLNPGTFQF